VNAVQTITKREMGFRTQRTQVKSEAWSLRRIMKGRPREKTTAQNVYKDAHQDWSNMTEISKNYRFKKM
jgi:hypothetical protein